MIQKFGHDSMRSKNTLTVLECIKNFGPVTKKTIQEKTGLSWGAISNISSELLNNRIISEQTLSESTIGRTPGYLKINSNENLLIGIDVNISGISLVLTDLASNVKQSMISELKSIEKDLVISQVIELVYDLMKKTGISKDKVMGIGLAMQGAVDVNNGVSVYAPHFLDWNKVPLKSILEAEFHIPVILEHDPNCMAMSEKWFGLASEYSNYLFLRLSKGIGMSVVINNEIYRGSEGNAGEFGHIIMDANGPKCSCGNYGCLEAYSSIGSMIQRAKDAIQCGRATKLQKIVEKGGILDINVLIEASTQGDDYALKIIDDACSFIGIGVSNLITLFNPELIVLAGELARSEVFFSRIRKVVNQKKWKESKVNILISNLESNAAALGAAAILIHKFFNGEEIKVAC